MRPRFRSGFTLTELMIAIALFGVLGAAVAAFHIQSLTAAINTQHQIGLMTDMRTLSNDMLFNASRAHELVLFASPAPADRASAESRLLIETDEDTGDLICPTGDLAVFVYYELPKPAAQPRYRVARIIAYALERNGDEPGCLTRLTIDLGASPSTDTVEQILTDRWTSAERHVFGELVTPLALADGAPDGTPRLFYKRSEQNLAVCGQLLKNSGNRDSRDRRTATRSTFFTVTTRS